MYGSRFSAMGGANEIVVAASDKDAAGRAIEAATGEVLRIEAKYSRYRPDSIISRINAAAGDGVFVACDEETNWLLDFADFLYRQSGGLFDATSGILRRSWNFSKPALPARDDLDTLLMAIDWTRVERDGRSLRLRDKGMEIDFGGFGKEYAADRAAKVLADHGITNGYVNLGGDIAAVGPQANGEAWLIGVQNPRNSSEAVGTFPLIKGGLATSGDAEKFFVLDGRRYCHILNPKTGYPVDCWASVSVGAPSALLAGALSTIAMLKEREGHAFLKAARCAFLIVDRDGQFLTSGNTSVREH